MADQAAPAARPLPLNPTTVRNPQSRNVVRSKVFFETVERLLTLAYQQAWMRAVDERNPDAPMVRAEDCPLLQAEPLAEAPPYAAKSGGQLTTPAHTTVSSTTSCSWWSCARSTHPCSGTASRARCMPTGPDYPPLVSLSDYDRAKQVTGEVTLDDLKVEVLSALFRMAWGRGGGASTPIAVRADDR